MICLISVVCMCVQTGDVVYTVDLQKSQGIPFHGPCELVLEGETVTVQNRVGPKSAQQHKIVWDIAHVKKYWVKSDAHQLIILVGRWEKLMYVHTYGIECRSYINIQTYGSFLL